MLHKQTAVNARSVVHEACKSRALVGAEREKEIEALAGYISDTVSVFSEPHTRRPCGLNATLLYLGIKLLYVFNCFGQLIALNRFLGGQYYNWAYETFMSVLQGQEWRESVVFPRVIMCDFAVRRLANPQRHTIQCVIMMNMINEKLYFFLYMWFLFVGIATLVNFFYYLAMLMVPALRTKFVLRNINKQQQKLRGFGRAEIHQFVQSFLRPDGILLLHFLRQHIGGRVTYELLNELLRLYWMTSHQGSTVTSKLTTDTNASTNSKLSNASTSPPTSEHALLLARGKTPEAKFERKLSDESFSKQATYKVAKL
uniref:Innexin n=1 Tax=Globodera pallida TaxID=36090 RepID=A0A183BP93_GLOPA